MADTLFKRKRPGLTGLRDKIVLIETLIFGLPALILLYMVFKEGYTLETSHLLLVVGISALVLTGMIILGQILEKVARIAASLKNGQSGGPTIYGNHEDILELREITQSLNGMVQKLDTMTKELERKSFELSTIRELTRIVDCNLRIDEQMKLLLEKCMAVTLAEAGSVFMVEPETRQKYLAAKSTPIRASELYHFRICAAIGRDDVTVGTLIDIEESVVKPILLEKRPLLIQDIFQDQRTMKASAPQYATPSFLSMPVIVGGAVSAILNLSDKQNDALFDDNDVQVLSIILRDMGFAMENAMLQTRTKEQSERIRRHDFEMEQEIEKRERLEKIMKYYDKL
jgi:hypothetical protein